MGWQRIRFRCPHRRANDAAIVNVLYTAGRKPIDLLFCRCAGYLLGRGQAIVRPRHERGGDGFVPASWRPVGRRTGDEAVLDRDSRPPPPRAPTPSEQPRTPPIISGD